MTDGPFRFSQLVTYRALRYSLKGLGKPLSNRKAMPANLKLRGQSGKD